MKSLIFILPVLIILAFADCGAQTLTQILERHEEAVGREELNKAQTVIISSEVIRGKMKIPVKVTYKRPSKVRSESSFGGKTYINAFDGKRGWESDPAIENGRPHVLNADESESLKSRADFDGLLYRYKEKGNMLKFLGKDKLNGRRIIKLKLTKKNGEEEIIFIDARTYLFARTVTETEINGKKTNRIADISDYRNIDGIKFPFRFEVNASGREIIQIVKSVEVNKTVPDSYFEFKNPAN